MTWSSRLPTANRPGNPYFSADTSAANSPDVINSVFVVRGAPPPKKRKKKKEKKGFFWGEISLKCVYPPTYPRVFVRFGRIKGKIQVGKGDFQGDFGVF